MGYIIGHESIQTTIEKFDSLKTLPGYFTNDSELNQLGKELDQNYGMKDESIKIYELALLEYPESFLLYYSYGELLSKNNDVKAIDCFRKCIDLYKSNPGNKDFSEEYEKALKKIEEKK